MNARLLVCAALLAIASVAAADAPHGIDKAAMDTSVKPGDDFFAYANGGWIKTAKIPADQSA
jgi:putative endopeptidase